MSRNEPFTTEQIESLLVELEEAERAGVFRPSRVPPLLRPAARSPRTLVFRLGVAGLAAAAAVALFAVLVQVPSGGSNDVTPFDPLTVASRPAVSVSQFTGCFAGPSAAPTVGDCSPADQDADGDVDLADFSVMQLSGARAM